MCMLFFFCSIRVQLYHIAANPIHIWNTFWIWCFFSRSCHRTGSSLEIQNMFMFIKLRVRVRESTRSRERDGAKGANSFAFSSRKCVCVCVKIALSPFDLIWLFHSHHQRQLLTQFSVVTAHIKVEIKRNGLTYANRFSMYILMQASHSIHSANYMHKIWSTVCLIFG